MKSPKPMTSRDRASVACTACQNRRVKCIKSTGETQCDQCQRSDIECATRPDRRRRRTSRVEVDSLRSRLQSLEAILRNQSASSLSTDLSQLRARDDANSLNTMQSNTNPRNLGHDENRTPHPAAEAEQQPSNPPMGLSWSPHRRASFCSNVSDSPLLELMSAGPSKSLIDRLISPGGQVRYDRSSGRLRPVNPIIALHQLGDLRPGFATGNSRDKVRRVDRLLRELNPETHDYLMECFWSYYDPVMQVVHEKLFEEDRRSGGGLAYSGFLHICILAMGYKYADPKRADIQKLTLRDKESVLHREAKYLVEFEFEEPGGIPSVQALLILGQLESGSGRDGVGWIYAGVAFRYAFDLGLNLDCSTLNLTQREREFRKFVLRACTVFDKLWAIYLGRMTTIKSSDLTPHVYLDRAQKVQGDGLEAAIVFDENMDNRCFDTLLDLLDITVKVVEYLYSRQSSLNHSDFLVIGSLDSDLKNWYNRLPSNLAWIPENIETAPLSYFHLHSQYHASLVLLHRPLASYDKKKAQRDGDGEVMMNSLATGSRAVCIKHTSEMIGILSRQYQRFDPYRAPQGQTQHIGTAAAALISAAAISEDPQERLRLLESLHNLAELTRAISPTYMAAEGISNLLDNLFKEPGWGYDSASGSDNAEGPRDTANKKLRVDDDIFENPPSFPSREVYGHHSSYANLDNDFSFTLDPQETIETLSSLNNGDVDMTGSNGMSSMSMGFLSPSLQEAGSRDKFPQESCPSLTSWAVPPFSPGDRPGNSFALENFRKSDPNYETMLWNHTIGGKRQSHSGGIKAI